MMRSQTWAQRLVLQMSKLFPRSVFLKETTEKVVSITIDDAPPRDDPEEGSFRQILAIISQYNQTLSTQHQVTFFPTTNHINQPSSILEDILKHGHEVGNHGQIDHFHVCCSKADFKSEFIAAHEVIDPNRERNIRWFRPARALYSNNMIETLEETGGALGYQPQFALASMIPFDTVKILDHPHWTYQYLKSFTFPGSILLLHAGKKRQATNTFKVLDMLLPYLAAQNYRVVTLSDLMGL